MLNSQQIILAFRAARQLGLEQVLLYAQYQLALRSGWLRRITPAREPTGSGEKLSSELAGGLLIIPKREELSQIIGDRASVLFAEANDLNQGKVRLFGGALQELDLVVPLPLQHWTTTKLDQRIIGVEDVKYLWEPARFTWVYPLARAYILSGDNQYAETFWQFFEAFTDINLPNMGPNWVSAQEVAIRIISFTFAYQIFSKAESSTEERIRRLSASIENHALRIPATLAYARAQNNNHLLSEAAGLITAGMILPAHPSASRWINTGQRWFNRGLEMQISPSGEYIQHSTNYHRMMLQLALWVSTFEGFIDPSNQERLALATKWVLGLVDPDTGRTPNLGHNDGSYLQPLCSCSYADYRPVLQAAATKFLGERPFPQGPWDEYLLWLGYQASEITKLEVETIDSEPILINEFPDSHLTIHDQTNSSWACLRAARFSSRPAHADQLHLDLWWREHNLALDPGTYSYNESPPWENALIHSAIHNTVTINGKDQMTQAGRFLWLDWAQADVIERVIDHEGKRARIIARHTGYQSLGVTHQRTIICESSSQWIVKDDLLPAGVNLPARQAESNKTTTKKEPINLYRTRLHWLVPDWSWEIDNQIDNAEIGLKIRSPLGWISILVGIQSATKINNLLPDTAVQLVRAGELIHGTGSVSQVDGWVSPTYGYKIPALSLAVEINSELPLKMTTTWKFPTES